MAAATVVVPRDTHHDSDDSPIDVDDAELQLLDLQRASLEEGVVGAALRTWVEEASPRPAAAANEYDMHLPFFDYVSCKRWSDALAFLNQHPETIRARHPSHRTPVLHFAVTRVNFDVGFVKELVRLMTEEDMEMLDNHGRTALGCGVKFVLNYGLLFEDAFVEVARCMVEKNTKLLSRRDPSTNMIPLVLAHSAEVYPSKLTHYLYSATPLDTLNARQAAQLISQGFKNKRFEIPWDLIQRCPRLGITKDLSGQYPLARLVDSQNWENLFVSDGNLKFWERWIYDRIHIKPSPKIRHPHLRITIPNEDNHHDDGNRRHLIQSAGVHRLHRMKTIHERILEFLGCMSEGIKQKYAKQVQDDILLRSAIFRAIQTGKVEIFKCLFKANRKIEDITNEDGMTVFQFAADCRQEKIYSLVLFEDVNKDRNFKRRDKFDNNLLHVVGAFSSLAQAKINHIQGAALQMQREVQWFKEVQSIAKPECLEAINLKDQASPQTVFTKYHKELMKEGEKSMKETATSSTVVGALIVTIMFAAAFTVPGGNDSTTGAPIYLKTMTKEFTIFIISVAISLFSSTTSVIIFLGILTARYKEDDFLRSLPTKMILGLFTLFLSITTMMIAFTVALYIMLHEKHRGIVNPLMLVSIVPIASYVGMQFPFFVEIAISTYGGSIFDRKNLQKRLDNSYDIEALETLLYRGHA